MVMVWCFSFNIVRLVGAQKILCSSGSWQNSVWATMPWVTLSCQKFVWQCCVQQRPRQNWAWQRVCVCLFDCGCVNKGCEKPAVLSRYRLNRKTGLLRKKQWPHAGNSARATRTKKNYAEKNAIREDPPQTIDILRLLTFPRADL
jgi:hypothetical protein